jgi:hypothetical protein
MWKYSRDKQFLRLHPSQVGRLLYKVLSFHVLPSLGKVSEGAVTATGGMVASVRCIELAKDTNDRLDRILAELKDEE